MRVAGRSSQPRELVRLSPLQFSISVGFVVILLAVAGLGGYFYGLKKAALLADETDVGMAEGLREEWEAKPANGDTGASVTFYTALTKPRREDAAASPPVPVVAQKTPVKTKVGGQTASGLPAPHSGDGSVMLQVASYQDQGNARKILQELSAEGYSGTIVKADLAERGIWFRVRVGPYGAGDAESVLNKLRNERNMKGFAVKP